MGVIKMSDCFNFDYGRIMYKHRFSIKRSLVDYEEIFIDNCISISSQFLYKTMACDKLVHEFYILYRDKYGKTQLLKLDSHDYVLKILYVGDMECCI